MSVQNAIKLVQKKDTELKIMDGLHNHDLDHNIHNIHASQNDKSSKLGPCHACNSPHFIKDCGETTCLRCKSNLDSHTPYKCPRKWHPNWHLRNIPPTKVIPNGHRMNWNTKPNLQLSVSTNKPDQMAKLLKATKEMTKTLQSHSNTHHHTLITLTITKIMQTHLTLTTIEAMLIHNTK